MNNVPPNYIVWNWESQMVRLGVDRLGAGPTVLLLPALSSISTRREMRLLQERLAPDFTTVAVDWPGFGDEPRPAIPWRPDAYLAFLRYVLTEAVPRPHATVAAGHAASYALAVGAAAPTSTGLLCLIAPTWRGPLPTMMGGKRRLGRIDRPSWGSACAGPAPLPAERQSSSRAYDGTWARLRRPKLAPRRAFNSEVDSRPCARGTTRIDSLCHRNA